MMETLTNQLVEEAYKIITEIETLGKVISFMIVYCDLLIFFFKIVLHELVGKNE